MRIVGIVTIFCISIAHAEAQDSRLPDYSWQEQMQRDLEMEEMQSDIERQRYEQQQDMDNLNCQLEELRGEKSIFCPLIVIPRRR